MTKRNDEPEGSRTLVPGKGERFDLEIDDDVDPGDESRTPAEDDDPDEREPGDEEGADDDDEPADEGDDSDGDDDVEALREKNRRLKQSNRELLVMKTRSEETRRENRVLKRQLEDLSSTHRGVRRDDTRGDPELAEAAAAVRSGTANQAQMSAVMRALGQEMVSLVRKQADLEDRSKSRIPRGDEAEVDRLMESGEYGSRRAAYKALIGERILRLRRQKRELEREQAQTKRNGTARREREREPEEREPRRERVGTAVRAVGKREAEGKTIPASKYAAVMDAGGPKARELYDRYKSGKVQVIPD
jgi:hypothetical protein